MNTLLKWTDAELEAELQRRKKEREDAPPPLKDIDWAKVLKLADVVKDRQRGCRREDDAQYMYEEVMKTVYGPLYFDWENENEYED